MYPERPVMKNPGAGETSSRSRPPIPIPVPFEKLPTGTATMPSTPTFTPCASAVPDQSAASIPNANFVRLMSSPVNVQGQDVHGRIQSPFDPDGRMLGGGACV